MHQERTKRAHACNGQVKAPQHSGLTGMANVHWEPTLWKACPRHWGGESANGSKPLPQGAVLCISCGSYTCTGEPWEDPTQGRDVDSSLTPPLSSRLLEKQLRTTGWIEFKSSHLQPRTGRSLHMGGREMEMELEGDIWNHLEEKKKQTNRTWGTDWKKKKHTTSLGPSQHKPWGQEPGRGCTTKNPRISFTDTLSYKDSELKLSSMLKI